MSHGSKSSKRRRILEELEVISSDSASEASEVDEINYEDITTDEINNEVEVIKLLDCTRTEDDTQYITGVQSHQYLSSTLESESNDSDIILSSDEDDNSHSTSLLDFDGTTSTPANIQLANWVIKHGISNTATSDLLKILKACYDSSLPIDARTLMKTEVSNTTIRLKDVTPGKYFHFGVANGIKNNHVMKNEHEILKLVIGIDGLPLTKSSSSTFWPILCYIRPNSKVVFPIGLFWGNDKPLDSNDFLLDFFIEIQELITNGLEIKNERGIICKAQIVLDVFCCDVPAKSFVLKTKGHSGFFSCSRCEVEGEYYNRRVCFPDMDSTKRTHEDFINKKQEEHHTGSSMSILINIPNINIIKCFSLDYMHLICLGIVRKLINLWLKGPLKVRIHSSKSKMLSSLLISLKSSVSNDFQRKPRGVDEVSRWKATEFRTFLLYLGPVVLKNIISEACYFNFLCLHISVSLLVTPNISDRLLKFCNNLLKYFIRKFGELYGKEWISHNVHALQHICDDYSNYGPLDNCSAFPFENHMKTLKKFIRKSHQPLQQAVKRYSEHNAFKSLPIKNNSNELFMYKSEHTKGPIPHILQITHQYKVISFKDTDIKINDVDCYIQTTTGEIVKVINICHTISMKIVVGHRFNTKTIFYQTPISSSKLNTFLVGNLNTCIEYWSVDDIKCKCMVLKYNENEMVAFALIHTYHQ